MQDIRIPKEIRGFDVKTFGPFTTRQAICVVIASALAVGTYFLEKSVFGLTEPPLMPVAIPAFPPLFMGWGKDFLHMQPEDYFKYVWIPNRKRKVNRKYVTENYNEIVALYKKDTNKKAQAVREAEKPKKQPVIPRELQDELRFL